MYLSKKEKFLVHNAKIKTTKNIKLLSQVLVCYVGVRNIPSTRVHKQYLTTVIHFMWKYFTSIYSWDICSWTELKMLAVTMSFHSLMVTCWNSSVIQPFWNHCLLSFYILEKTGFTLHSTSKKMFAGLFRGM